MKRIIVILISCILALSLVGCSESGGRWDVGSSYMVHFTVIMCTLLGRTIKIGFLRGIHI